jgi:hypothetical protein
MDRQFSHRFRKKTDSSIQPSKSAASHTAQNLQPHPPEPSEVVTSHLHTPKPKKTLKERLKSVTKKQWIIISIIAGLVVIGGAVGLYFLLKEESKPAQQTQKEVEPPPAPTTVASNLTGIQVDPTVNDRAVTGVMIENSLDARPQSGMDQAGVLFEAIAEGGITRYLLLFQDTQPDYIGPVRSVRPYYVQWGMGFDAAIAHVGGSADGLALVRTTKDLDQFAGSAYFSRVSNRAAPHNVYTSMAKLNEYEAKKGYGKANYTSLPRKADAPSATPDARSIDFRISSANYNVHYDYDPNTNSYKRSLGGKPHTDERSGAQLSPKTVVALIMPQGSSGKYTTYGTIGSGQMFVFQDGLVGTGTWRKDSNSSNFVLTNHKGETFGLNPGQTWFTVLGGTDRVTYTP